MSHQPSPSSSQQNLPTAHLPTTRQKSKAYNTSIAAQSDDLKYQSKYKDLKQKVKDIEADNDKLLLKVLKTKRNIKRLRLERAILYERLGTLSQPPPPSTLLPVPFQQQYAPPPPLTSTPVSHPHSSQSLPPPPRTHHHPHHPPVHPHLPPPSNDGLGLQPYPIPPPSSRPPPPGASRSDSYNSDYERRERLPPPPLHHSEKGHEHRPLPGPPVPSGPAPAGYDDEYRHQHLPPPPPHRRESREDVRMEDLPRSGSGSAEPRRGSGSAEPRRGDDTPRRITEERQLRRQSGSDESIPTRHAPEEVPRSMPPPPPRRVSGDSEHGRGDAKPMEVDQDAQPAAGSFE